MNYYQIADAAKKVNVESHVLRYWEEELQLPIERNKQGHRLYTDEDLNRFLYIKELKKEGLQLRAIRTKVHMRDKQSESMAENGKWVQEKPQDKALLREQAEKHLPECKERSAGAGQLEEEKTRKAARLCMMLQQMVVTAVHEENESLLREIKKGVAETVSKEMNYQFSLQEQREEEHYKKLDEILRERERRNRMTLGDRKRLKREHQRAEREKLRVEKENARREKEKTQQEQARMEKERLQKEKENARIEKEKLQKEKESARKEKEKLQKEKEQARREKEKTQQEQARMEKEKLRQEREHARKAKEKIQQAKARGSLFGSREKNRPGQEQQEGLS